MAGRASTILLKATWITILATRQVTVDPYGESYRRETYGAASDIKGSLGRYVSQPLLS